MPIFSFMILFNLAVLISFRSTCCILDVLSVNIQAYKKKEMMPKILQLISTIFATLNLNMNFSQSTLLDQGLLRAVLHKICNSNSIMCSSK